MKLTPTKQQQDIITSAQKGKSITVKALAGAAKTSTCVMVAEEVVKVSLYAAYNKSIATEAARVFPTWVECRTIHSLAYGAIVKGTGYYHKLGGFLDRNEVRAVTDIRLLPDYKKSAQVEKVISTITSFCNSGSYDIDDFVKDIAGKEYIIQFWESMVDVRSKTQITHDTYLKLFQLSLPELQYELIYLDESQDFNPVILAIVLSEQNKHIQKIFIGDPFQSIYGFREAVNAFDCLPASYTSHDLTTSFRFTQDIADTGLAVLRHAGYTGELTGAGSNDSGTTALLAKTNADLFSRAVGYAKEGKKVYVVGGMEELFKKLVAAQALKRGVKAKVYDKQIVSLGDWDNLVEVAKTELELSKLITILKQTTDLDGDIAWIKKALVAKAAKADITLSTAHKSKGLGFGKVEIVDGFIPRGKWWDKMVYEEKEAYLVKEQVINLIYIAITRAEKEVTLPRDIKQYFGLGG